MQLLSRLRLCLSAFVLSCCLPVWAAPVLDYPSAVILQYHHVADDTPESTSVTPAQFAEQMAYLADNEFNVISVNALIEAIKKKQPLPNKTVAITFDDGYRNIATNAHPILKQHNFPYTLFVSIEPIDQKRKLYLNWDELRALAKDGVDIANHTWGHEHLIHRLADEDQATWLTRVVENVERTEARLEQEVGQRHQLLAYPYGEYNTDLQNALKAKGYYALGQQSGAAGLHSDLMALPRFPVAVQFAKMSELKVKMLSLNMPVLAQNVKNPELAMGQWQPQLEIRLDMTDIRQSQVMCFIQGQGGQKPTWINEDTFTIQATKSLSAGRSRYNCTAPSKKTGRYYWFSQPWVRPYDSGKWPQW